MLVYTSGVARWQEQGERSRKGRHPLALLLAWRHSGSSAAGPSLAPAVFGGTEGPTAEMLPRTCGASEGPAAEVPLKTRSATR